MSNTANLELPGRSYYVMASLLPSDTVGNSVDTVQIFVLDSSTGELLEEQYADLEESYDLEESSRRSSDDLKCESCPVMAAYSAEGGCNFVD